jgi:Secretion system C-terminal sorting domain
MVKQLLSTFLLAVCFATISFAQPANDNCANAEVLPIPGIGVFNFTTVDATTDGPEHLNDCVSSGSSGTICYNDVWYSFTPDWTGFALYSTCGTANFDTKIVVYDAGATCPLSDGQVLACNEDGPAACTNFTSQVIFPVTSGSTYLLRLGGWGDGPPGESGEGTFRIEEYIFFGPPNDDCVNAIELFMDSDDSISVVFTTVDATTDGPQHVGQDCFGTNGEEYDHNNIWYKWTATYSGGLDISTCGTANYDSRLSAYGPGATCIPDPALLIGCSDDGIDDQFLECPDYTSHDRFYVEEGQSYLISIGGWSASDVGSGFFTFKKADVYTPPVNDNCSNATSAYIITTMQADEFDVIFPGNNQTASFTDSLAGPSCRPTGEFWDVWYSFNSGFNTDLELRFSIVSPDDADFIIDLFADCANTDTSSAAFCFQTADVATLSPVYQLTNFPGVPTEYYLRISTRILTTMPGNFWFQLVGEPYSSVDEPDFSHFRLYPNPTASKLNLDFGLAESTSGHWEMLNPLGQIVMSSAETRYPAGQTHLDLDTNDLQPGVYFLRLKLDDKERTVRFIKQ